MASKVEICNLTLSLLGNKDTISNIDTPKSDKEIIFAQWYDVCRQTLLKQVMPNFSLARKIVGKLVLTPVFGFEYAYEYPNDCLKVLGRGDIDLKEREYTVESKPGGGQAIYLGYDYEDGLELRYVKNVTDVNSFSPEFKILLAQYIGKYVALPITQNPQKAVAIKTDLPLEMASVSGMNAQENPPIRISRSRFRAARTSYVSRNPVKR